MEKNSSNREQKYGSEGGMKESRAQRFMKREKGEKAEKKAPLGRGTHRHAERRKSVFSRAEILGDKKIPDDARDIIENFGDIAADVMGLSSKQRVFLAAEIRKLSHKLTDERTTRRVGYMNDAQSVSAYISYFMWWNIVRLTRLFSSLPKKALDIPDGGIAIDIGSGPLTAVTALYLARPELRSRRITWYCMDISQNALAQGEEIFLSVAAKILSKGGKAEPWRIIRVKGAIGTEIKEKASLVTCANAFNEMIQNETMPTDFLAKKYSGTIESYLEGDGSKPATAILVEPGDPHSARFVSLMRDAFIRRGFLPVSPCPHAGECPMAGRTQGKRDGKWCNFAFSTDGAPDKLLKLSEKAGLPKERASLSFVVCRKDSAEEAEKKRVAELEKTGEERKDARLRIRIASDFIKLPELHKSGYYACSELGLLLAIDESGARPKNGESLEIPYPQGKLAKDKKSGARIVSI